MLQLYLHRCRSKLVRIESESLPTGIAIPKAGHISIPIAFTPSNNAWSSPFDQQQPSSLQKV